MKTSSALTPKVNDAPSILLLGPPGGGKTTLAMQFPGVAFIDCDENLDGPELYIRKHRKELTYLYDQVRKMDNGNIRETHEIQDYILKALDGLKTNKDVKTVCVDSLTAINEFIIRKILKKQNKLDGCMEARDWQPFKSDFYFFIFSKLRALNRTSICMCHETKLTEPDPKNMMGTLVKEYEPSVQGKIGDYFGAFFTDVWRCTAEPLPGNKLLYIIDSQKKPLTPMLKNSFGMPTRIEVKQDEIAYDKIRPYLERTISPPSVGSGPQGPGTTPNPAVK